MEAKQIKLKADANAMSVAVIEDGRSSTGVNWQTEVNEVAEGIYHLSFFEGERSLLISLMPMHRGFYDVAVCYANLMNPHKLRRMAVGPNGDLSDILNKMVNSMVEGR